MPHSTPSSLDFCCLLGLLFQTKLLNVKGEFETRHGDPRTQEEEEEAGRLKVIFGCNKNSCPSGVTLSHKGGGVGEGEKEALKLKHGWASEPVSP